MRYSLTRITIGGALLGATTFTTVNASPVGDRGRSSGYGFPPSIYPQPAKFPRWGLGEGCASLAGVGTLGPGASKATSSTLAQFGRTNLQTDLHLSDRAFWPLVRLHWAPKPPGKIERSGHLRIVRSGPAIRSPYARFVGRNCGAAIVNRSIWLAVCGRTCTPATTGHYFLIDRHGHCWSGSATLSGTYDTPRRL